MSDPTNPKPGDLVINAEGLAVINVTPEEINRYLKFRDGVDKAISCIENLKPEDIERAGLNLVTVQETIQLIVDYRRANDLLPAAEKLAELLYETKMNRAHRVSLNFGELASQARRRGERDPMGAEILGAVKELLDYQFGPGKKAAATKAKRANAGGEQPAKPGKPVNPEPPAKPIEAGPASV